MGKKNNEVQSKNNAYFERIEALEKEIESYRADGEKLGGEILSLRRSVSSYKGANTKLKYENEQLSKEIERLRVLGREGDELCEQYAGEKDALSKIIDEKEKVISGLNSQVSELRDKISEQAKEIEGLCVEKEDLSKALDYEQKPWWKKIF